MKRITGDKHRKGLGTSRVDVVEVDVVSAFPSSTTRIRDITLRKRTSINHCE